MMKTILSATAKPVIKAVAAIAFATVLFSCQKNLTQADTSLTLAAPDTLAVTEKFVAVDTLTFTSVGFMNDDSAVVARIADKVKRFYAANNFKTKWLEQDKPGALYHALVSQLKQASRHGLQDQYLPADLEHQVKALYHGGSTLHHVAAMDVQLTQTFFLFATHLREGRLANPGDKKYIWIRESKNEDYRDVTSLAATRNDAELDATIRGLQPVHEQYFKLQQVLAHYLSLEKSEGNLKPIRSNEKIKPGDHHAAISLIRKKIALTENIEAGDEIDSLLYDAQLATAVKSFQERHGLEADGVIGDKTLKLINRSFREKAALVVLNMERLRWLPNTFGEQYILVNIPEYKLRIFEKDQQTLDMDVIVGATQTPSPVFHDSLERVVFSPTWTVPPTIVKSEILPRLKRDSAYYNNRDFEFYKNGVAINPAAEVWNSTAVNVMQYRVVQKPGPANALGLVKFVMPNDMNIYLHDTPDHSLFSKRFRALSHGCIRLDEPATFAAYLLQNESTWNEGAIRKAMRAGKPATVALKKYYQVHLLYQTVWVDDKGTVQFRDDIYGHDERQLRQLNQTANKNMVVAAR